MAHWQFSALTVVRSEGCPIWQFSDLTAIIWQLSANPLLTFFLPVPLSPIFQFLLPSGCMQLFRGPTRKPPSELDFSLNRAVLKFEALKTFLVVDTIYKTSPLPRQTAGSAFSGGKRPSLIFEGGPWTLWNNWPCNISLKYYRRKKIDTSSDIMFHSLRLSSLRDFKSKESNNSKIRVLVL